MSEDPTNSTDPRSEAGNATSPRELTIWDNTPEEEQRDIEAFMEMAWADMDASEPPYNWADDPSDIHKFQGINLAGGILFPWRP